MSIQIEQDGSIAMSSSNGEIIDAQDARCWGQLTLLFDTSQKAVSTRLPSLIAQPAANQLVHSKRWRCIREWWLSGWFAGRRPVIGASERAKMCRAQHAFL